ncbi:winged helix-turn-helix transcriptional regulator [Pseudarthrobacter sp. ATCC 49987]|uniref:winged helix-turn-helix transcriptional regulator n=1 Tax=Pseudarthrobacter sp. ATCC 49987 TaxID=2698204 RepID=UPI00136AC7B8|nr:helix-turn-helix transcriptional regulator [Pseudarthrobacter sp. ATCC 49987]
MHPEPRIGFPNHAALEFLGAGWALLVLRDVICGHPRHFRELLARSEEGITSRILASGLKHLVDPPPWAFGPWAHSAVPVFTA